jgi:hypothetical protein
MRTIVWWRRAGVKAIGLIFLAGCNSRQQVPQFPPVDATQRASVLDASAKLRGTFNGGRACESIYEGASQKLQSIGKTAWLTECDQFRADWGTWESFTPTATVRCGMPEVVVCVDGTGAFTSGNRTLELIWLLDSRTQFVTLRWQLVGGGWMDLRPDLRPNERHHFDSPPVPGKSRPEKS